MGTAGLKRTVFSVLAFFGMLGAASIGYSAIVAPSPVATGSGLSAGEWNKMVAALEALDAGLSHFSFSSGKVGIGTGSPSHGLHVAKDTTDTTAVVRITSTNAQDAHIRYDYPSDNTKYWIA